MTLQGDLSTLDLADLLQNMELHGRTGLLSIEGEEGNTQMYFQEGRLALLNTAERPSLVDVLVASGAVDSDDLERARKRRKRSGRSLAEVLVEMGVIEREAVQKLARDRLLGDVCEVVSASTGTFTFQPGPIPRGMFDAEERRLGLDLAVNPLLLEAARRSDHWKRIRSEVPSDSAHYKLTSRARGRQDQDGLTRAMGELLDGTRSVAEVAACFPHRRFDAYERLANLAESRSMLMVDAGEMAAMALQLANTDLERAWDLIQRGLLLHSHHPDLLEAQGQLAEELGRPESAVDGLKILAQLRWESGDRNEARLALERALELDDSDTALWERSLELAQEDERFEDVRAYGLRLVDLYREPGLHRKACAVLETLLELEPESWELQRERAHSLADCGDLAQAVKTLTRYGERRLARDEYDQARQAFEEVLSLDPSAKAPRKTLETIQTGDFERMVVHRRLVVHRLVVVACVALLVGALVLEGLARGAYRTAVRAVSERELIEERQYEEAADLLQDVLESHPFSVTTLFDVRPHLTELRRKATESRR
ncbi:MAG: DUF4388 domain-containing protein [Planctomycetota bacterium]